MNIQLVKINPEGDGTTALYIEGALYTYGDYYHNKIDYWLDGFLAGLKYASEEGWYPGIFVEKWYVLGESDIDESYLEDLMLGPPERFEDLPTDFLTQEYE